ncbi:hypothetical protein HUG10_21450 (plasmid) [Halorarum halophilum]|uniref:Uncharacterized protein n=1 Tax=Halorarum halophilum TaxID=2743090 RepID=A0A7D5KIN9_9EURY|nr:hypothetical protein [Halobaculum halophilum]QLG30156.1 hypothetical protein HUG10_21450 [Halobaculum halophilum]
MGLLVRLWHSVTGSSGSDSHSSKADQQSSEPETDSPPEPTMVRTPDVGDIVTGETEQGQVEAIVERIDYPDAGAPIVYIDEYPYALPLDNFTSVHTPGEKTLPEHAVFGTDPPEHPVFEPDDEVPA